MKTRKRTRFWCRLLAVTLALATSGPLSLRAFAADKHNGVTCVAYFNKDRLSTYSDPSHVRVIVYLHGVGSESEAPYDQMFRDLVDGAGVVVVYPKFNSQIPNNATYSVSKSQTLAALAEIDLILFLHGVSNWGDNFGEQPVLAGHSLGALYALKMADDFAKVGEAVPTAVVLHDPSGMNNGPALGNLGNIPANTLLLVVISSQAWYHETGSTIGYSQNSGIWRIAWESGIFNSFKHAYLVPGDHDGMKGDKYRTTGWPYTSSLFMGAFLNWAWPVTWWDGQLQSSTTVTGWFHLLF